MHLVRFCSSLFFSMIIGLYLCKEVQWLTLLTAYTPSKWVLDKFEKSLHFFSWLRVGCYNKPFLLYFLLLANAYNFHLLGNIGTFVSHLSHCKSFVCERAAIRLHHLRWVPSGCGGQRRVGFVRWGLVLIPMSVGAWFWSHIGRESKRRVSALISNGGARLERLSRVGWFRYATPVRVLYGYQDIWLI